MTLGASSGDRGNERWRVWGLRHHGVAGVLILAGALLRSGAVSRWLPMAVVGTTVAQFAVHDSALDFVQIAAMSILVLFGVQLARARRPA